MKYIIKLYEYEGITYYYKNAMEDTTDIKQANRYNNKLAAEAIIYNNCDKTAVAMEVTK